MADMTKATRDGFGEEILSLGKNNKDIYVVDVDIAKSCRTTPFSKALPQQHVNVGIAEQNVPAWQLVWLHAARFLSSSPMLCLVPCVCVK